MTLEEFKKNRKTRLAALHEALANMPKADGDGVHGEVDAVMFDAITASEERDEKVKDSFKEKNKEVREFIKEQDKATGASKDEKAEDRLILDESLFNESETFSDYTTITLEIGDDGQGKTVWISHDDGGSGAEYPCESMDDLKRAIEEYIYDYCEDCFE